MYASKEIISCSVELHGATMGSAGLSPQGRQTLRVVPFWMPALMPMAMALLLLLLLIPLRSATLCFSAAAPLRPDGSIKTRACN